MRNWNTPEIPRRWILIIQTEKNIPLEKDSTKLQPIIDPARVFCALNSFCGLIQVHVTFSDENVSYCSRTRWIGKITELG